MSLVYPRSSSSKVYLALAYRHRGNSSVTNGCTYRQNNMKETHVQFSYIYRYTNHEFMRESSKSVVRWCTS